MALETIHPIGVEKTMRKLLIILLACLSLCQCSGPDWPSMYPAGPALWLPRIFHKYNANKPKLVYIKKIWIAMFKASSSKLLTVFLFIYFNER